MKDMLYKQYCGKVTDDRNQECLKLRNKFMLNPNCIFEDETIQKGCLTCRLLNKSRLSEKELLIFYEKIYENEIIKFESFRNLL